MMAMMELIAFSVEMHLLNKGNFYLPIYSISRK